MTFAEQFMRLILVVVLTAIAVAMTGGVGLLVGVGLAFWWVWGIFKDYGESRPPSNSP